MGQNEEEVGTWFEKNEVDQVEIRTTPQTVYLARHVVGSSHKENKEANSQIDIWRQAVRRANDVTQKEMKPQEVALLTCVCTLCGNIDGRIVGAQVYCDKRLAWDNGEWTAHDLTCSSPEGGKEDDEVFLEANEQIDIEDEDQPMGLGLYEKSLRETCFKKRLDEGNLCPEGNLFLVPMCDTCNKTQETANFWFELKPGTILVETCVRENYAKKKRRLVVYLCPSKDGARLWRPDCCLDNKNPRSSAKKHSGIIPRTSLLSYRLEKKKRKVAFWCMACNDCVEEDVKYKEDKMDNFARMSKVLADHLPADVDNFIGFVLVQAIELLEMAVQAFIKQLDNVIEIKDVKFHFSSLRMTFQTTPANEEHLKQLADEMDSKSVDEALIKTEFDKKKKNANEEDSKALEEAEQYFLDSIMPCKEKTEIIDLGGTSESKGNAASLDRADPYPQTLERARTNAANAAEMTKRMCDAAAEAAHEMCMDKMAWAQSHSLDAPPKLGESLKEAMMRREHVKPSSEISDVNRLLQMCSGGRALKGCIPTTQFWSKSPTFSLMGTPKDADLKSLSWHKDFEYHFESLDEASDTLTMAKCFGTSSIDSFVKDTRRSFLGFSGGSGKFESTSAEETKESSSITLTQKSRAQTVHSLRLKSIARFKIELPQEGLPLSQRALEDLRSLYETWKLRWKDQSGSASIAGDQELSKWLRQFFEDFGSHLTSGTFSLGGIFIHQGVTVSNEKLSAAAAMDAFSQARSKSSSSESNSGFDGAVLGDVIKDVGNSMEQIGSEAALLAEGAVTVAAVAEGGPAAAGVGAQAGQLATAAVKMQTKAMSAMTKSVGAVMSSIKVSSSVGQSSQSASQTSEEVQNESSARHSQTATCITCSTYGGAPTHDVQSWTDSIMQETEQGARLEVIDTEVKLVSVWDIVKRAFWDFGHLDWFSVSLDELKTIVSSSLNLILDTATHRCYTKCEWMEDAPHGNGDLYDLLQKSGWVLMVRKTQPEVVPPEQCLVFVNYDYKYIQNFAEYIKVEFKSMFGDSCFCPSCEGQFLPHELRDHQAYCSANQTFAEIFSPQEMELFWSYELRMEETLLGPLQLGFCLITHITCELCGGTYPACDRTFHAATCTRTNWKDGETPKESISISPAAAGCTVDNYITLGGGLKPQVFIPITRKLPSHYAEKLKEGYVMRRCADTSKPALVPSVNSTDVDGTDGTASKLQVEIYLALEKLEEDMRPICHELRRHLGVSELKQFRELEKKLKGRSGSWRPRLGEKAKDVEALEDSLEDARYELISLSKTESTKHCCDCIQDIDRAFNVCIEKFHWAKKQFNVQSTASCQWFLGRWWKSTVDPKSTWKNHAWGLCRAVPVSEPCLDRVPEPLKKKDTDLSGASSGASDSQLRDFLSPKLELVLQAKSITGLLCQEILNLKKVGETDATVDTSQFDQYWKSFCSAKKEPHAAAQSLGQGHVQWRNKDALEMACEMAALGKPHCGSRACYVLCEFLKFCKEHLLTAETLQKWAARIVTCGEWESVAELLKLLPSLTYLEFWGRCVVQPEEEEEVWKAVCLHPEIPSDNMPHGKTLKVLLEEAKRKEAANIAAEKAQEEAAAEKKAQEEAAAEKKAAAFAAAAAKYRGDICHAAAKNDLAAVSAFVDWDAAAVDHRDRNGRTALHIAAEFSSVEVAQFLLASKAAVEALADDPRGMTPLHFAAEARPRDRSRCIEIAKLLLAARASPHTGSKFTGYTSLDTAKDENHSDMIRLFEAA